MRGAEQARPWFTQAASDLRVAKALLAGHESLEEGDIGCHVAAMCSQTLEKALKAYVIVNRVTPRLGHRPDGYIRKLLEREGPMLRHRTHYGHLSKLFDQKTKREIIELFGLTPGGRGMGNDYPNTEYPWKEGGEWKQTPFAAPEFNDRRRLEQWFNLARRVNNKLLGLAIAAERGQGF